MQLPMRLLKHVPVVSGSRRDHRRRRCLMPVSSSASTTERSCRSALSLCQPPPAFAAHMLILPGDEIALVGDHVLDRGRPQASSSRRTR